MDESFDYEEDKTLEKIEEIEPKASLNSEERDRFLRDYHSKLLTREEREDWVHLNHAEFSLFEPEIVVTKQKFVTALLANPEFRLRRGYEKHLREAEEYFENNHKDNIPKLVREMDDALVQFLFEETHGGPPRVRIESMRDIDRLLEKYPEKREDDSFVEQYRKSSIYLAVRNNHYMKQTELAPIHDIQQPRISDYQKGKETILISHLRRNEEIRIIDEWKKNGLSRCIRGKESDIVERYLESKHIETMEQIDASMYNISSGDSCKLNSVLAKLDPKFFAEEDFVSIANEITHALLKTKSRIAYMDFKIENSSLIESWLQENRTEIERIVHTQLNLNISEQSVRIGIVDERIYLWNPDKTPNDMINVWARKYFHFNPSNLAQIILETGRHLGLNNGYEILRHLNKLVEQIVSNRPKDKILNRNAKSRVLGEIFHLQCDIIGVSPRYLEDKIERMTGSNGRGGVIHPKLLKGTELEILRARLGAIINSDCWLGEDGRLFYSEANKERIKIVANLFQQFGDLAFKIEPNEFNKSYRMWIPKPIGNAFIYWGFTSGDKPIRNERLSSIIREASMESYVAYLEDLISEDGCFDQSNGFRWSRTNVLKLGTTDVKYKMESELSIDEIEFLVKFKHTRRYSNEVYVPITRLENYAKHPDESESEIVEHILSVVEKNRSRLLDDEVSLANKLGIEIHVYPEYITLYNETGRISLKWVATTERKDDSIRWALIAPPNDPRKNMMVQEWLILIPDDVARIKKQL
ncbi:MAG: hypothetical protein E3J86_13555 [Candidatus Thorarchaeota archaeon]|nr:MAG: hypothetical protein E3J86_13555 [Candidatus Thorarchaeota archaeon]